jgi:hypothetical protein
MLLRLCVDTSSNLLFASCFAGQSQTGTKNKPLRPFLDPEVCRVRQMNCPSIIAAESLNRPAGRSSSMTWFNSVRSRGDRAGRTNTKSTRYKRLNNAAA